MGMDLILGAVILIAALRGWFKGFFAQAIRLGGVVGGVYLAGPIRDLARPIAAERLTSMAPDLLDRILWWVAAFGAFVVLSGTATGLLMAYRRRLARERQLMAYRHESFWQCMDTLRDKRLLESMWDSDAPPWRVWD